MDNIVFASRIDPGDARPQMRVIVMPLYLHASLWSLELHFIECRQQFAVSVTAGALDRCGIEKYLKIRCLRRCGHRHVRSVCVTICVDESLRARTLERREEWRGGDMPTDHVRRHLHEIGLARRQACNRRLRHIETRVDQGVEERDDAGADDGRIYDVRLACFDALDNSFDIRRLQLQRNVEFIQDLSASLKEQIRDNAI